MLSLAVLFISLLNTTSYASLTAIEIKNFILNSYAYDYSTDTYDNDKVTSVLTFLGNHTSEISTMVQYSEQEDANYIVMHGPDQLTTASLTTNLTIWISKTPFWVTNNTLQTQSGKLIARAAIKASNNTFAIYTTGNSASGYSNSWVKYYAQGDIYEDSSLEDVRFPYGVHPSGLLTSPYFVSDYFNFVLNSNLTNITINGDSVPLIDFQGNQANTAILGQLGLAKNFYNAELFQYRYQNGRWKLINVKTYEKIGTTTNNQISVTLIGNQYYEDTLYSLQMNPDPDSLFSPYSQPFFVKGSNTVISGGALDLNNTFSGDYYNNYNNDTNTQDIINNTNDMSDVDNSLNEFISGDALDIANKFGFVMFSQEYYDFIYNTIVDIVGVLEETGDVYFDYSMHGESPTRIYSSSFTIPNGTLKNFITMFLISCTVFAFYKYIADILELISTGNILEALSEFKVDRNIFKM